MEEVKKPEEMRQRRDGSGIIIRSRKKRRSKWIKRISKGAKTDV